MKIILDLCGGPTGSWSKPYADAGYDVMLIDPILGGALDVRLLELKSITDRGVVHGILAAPPCTHFSGSGARWWKAKGSESLLEGLSVVDACLRIILLMKPKFWCLENPVGRLNRWIGQPEMYFNPCDYGDPYTKKTALWGRFKPPTKKPVEPTEGSKMHLLPPGKNRQMLRSITPPGFAKAFFESNQ